jgi:hypothetical protein
MLRLYSRLSKGYDMLKDKLVQLYENAVFIFSDKVYVLFENNATPYLRSSVNTGAVSSALPQWYFHQDTKSFIYWKVGESPEKSISDYLAYSQLPILSMGITKGDECLHDLDDFINSITVYKPEDADFPSTPHLIGAWSLTSKIILDTTRYYKVSILTDMADTICVPLYTHETLDTLVKGPKIE